MPVPYTFAGATGSIPLQQLDDNFTACLSTTVTIAQGGTGQITNTAAFDALSPLTTKGDLIVSDGTDNVRLPVGTNGQSLVADSTVAAGVKWAAASSGTVTSVGLSAPAMFTVTNSPITSTGTIAITYSGTALPVANGGTGLTALGTGVTTALGINVGSSGAVVTNGGALGTPSSGVASSMTVDGTDAVGFRNVPINSQSAAYTAVLADSGKAIFHPSTDANARTFTIPANASVAYPIGTVLTFINMTTQVVSIAITTDTMYLAGTGTTGTRSLALYGMASAIKMTSTTWLISGNGLT